MGRNLSVPNSYQAVRVQGNLQPFRFLICMIQVVSEWVGLDFKLGFSDKNSRIGLTLMYHFDVYVSSDVQR